MDVMMTAEQRAVLFSMIDTLVTYELDSPLERLLPALERLSAHLEIARQLQRDDGDHYIVNVSPEKLEQVVADCVERIDAFLTADVENQGQESGSERQSQIDRSLSERYVLTSLVPARF